ncbi:hypothetical protein QFC20_007270 [Naganishia adeliensis]|uniref:Uncharacterized protein n=1 Tax=Naganishia adeliensis TaxID=92952 RepID=A0ACC2V148_9TREE|nr:hypothetical protein QFC20_007270 [Naganishia adeliensis]
MPSIPATLRAWFPRMAHDHQSPGGAYHHRWTLGRVLRSYAGDWALVVGLWFLLELLNQIGGHKREFSLTDITIQRPFKAEHVPPVLLFVISLAVPLGFLLVVGAGVYKSRWDVHNGVLGKREEEER